MTDSNKRLTRLEDRVRELKVDYDENKSVFIRAGAIKTILKVEAKTEQRQKQGEQKRRRQKAKEEAKTEEGRSK